MHTCIAIGTFWRALSFFPFAPLERTVAQRSVRVVADLVEQTSTSGLQRGWVRGRELCNGKARTRKWSERVRLGALNANTHTHTHMRAHTRIHTRARTHTYIYTHSHVDPTAELPHAVQLSIHRNIMLPSYSLSRFFPSFAHPLLPVLSAGIAITVKRGSTRAKSFCLPARLPRCLTSRCSARFVAFLGQRSGHPAALKLC